MDTTYSRRGTRGRTTRVLSTRACSLSTTSVRSCYSSLWKLVSVLAILQLFRSKCHVNTGVELNTTVVLQEVKPIAFRHCRPPRMLSVLIKTFTWFRFSCYLTCVLIVSIIWFGFVHLCFKVIRL